MSKINELVNVLKSGSRTNKYRILIPSDESRTLDIICHSTSIPGRIITPVDVVIKGKKTQIVGESSLSGSWTATFYNDSQMSARKFFTEWIENLHSLDLNVNSGLFKSVGDTVRTINSNISSLKNAVNDIKNGNIADIILERSQSPYYQKDITIQQLDGDGNPIFEVLITGAFPINIEDIQLDSSNSEISSTSITFAYTDVKTKDNSKNKLRDLLIGKI